MSLNRLAVAPVRLEVIAELNVLRLLVWQVPQPTALKTALPLLIDVEPPGVVGFCAGGARRRMNIANATVSLSVPVAVLLKFVWSSGVGFRHPAGMPSVVSSPGRGRSCVKSSFDTPCSTL